MKRWKSALEEYNYELRYKPGKSNVVADALSRPPLVSQINSLTASQHSDESSSHELIPAVEIPINVFRNQLILLIGEDNSYQLQFPFPKFRRHTFVQPSYSKENIISIFKRYLIPNIINGLMTNEETMGIIQNLYPLYFKNYKIRFTQTKVTDLLNSAEQEEHILKIHNRANRNARENKTQLLENYYFPQMNAKINKLVKQCQICQEHKYDRHPQKPELKPTPIPQYPGHILHIDIYSTEGNLVLTALDKFSKYAQTRILKSRAVQDIMEPLRQILFAFGVPKIIVFDNEKSFSTASICFLLKDQLKIEIYKTPPHSSTVNGQVERFHSTLSEIMRCLKTEKIHKSFLELLDRSVYEYNCSVHSTIGKKTHRSILWQKC